MNIKHISILLIILLIVTACTAAPKWVSNPRDVLDFDDYITGIGSGTSYKAALTNAQTDLAQQISVKVESVLELKSVNLEAGGKEFYAESIEKSSKITVDQMLRGITVARQEEEKGTYWVMVTLSKSRMLQALRGELDTIYKSAETLFNEGVRLANEGKILTAIKNFTDAQAVLPEFYAKKTFYENFAPSAYPISGNLSIASLDSAIRAMLTSVVFEIVSGDRQSATLGSELPEHVVFRAIYRSRSGDRIPLSGYPVKVSYGDNTLISKGQTDNSGQYSVNVIATPQSGSRGKVIIRSDAFMLPAYMNKSAEQSVAEAHYTTSESAGITAQLVIKDSKGVRLEKVERNITKTMNNNNVSISNNSPLIFEGLVSVTDSRMVEGMGAPKRVVKVRLDLNLGVAKGKDFIGSISGTGQGMSDKDEKDAISRAYDNISINNRELAQMLSAASSKISEALGRAEKMEVKPAESVVQKQEPIAVKPPKDETITQSKDRHWFSSEDRLYTTEEFTVRSYKLWSRAGKFLSESGSGFNVKAQILDYEKDVVMTCDYYYQTVAGEINNIKKDDIVFVFHTYEAPENEKQAKTQQWQMVRVTDAKELLNGKVYVSSSNWAPIEAIRVLVK